MSHVSLKGYTYREITPIMENQVENNMENEMESVSIGEFTGD